MGNKTVKRVGILLGIFVLLGGTSFALWRFQVERKAQGVVARAEKAEEEGDYARAAELYREYLTVKPTDVEVKVKYADVLSKSDWAARQPELALKIYEDVIGQFAGREDVRRRAAEMAAELATRSGGNLFERARDHLAILLKTAPNDGHLEFLMGRCYEEDKEYDLAAKSYGSAIEHGAPERIEAARRRAMLLDSLGRTDEADQVINAMVESAPDDYRVYLERGRYRNRPDPPGRGDGVRKALKKAPGLGLGWLAFYLGGGDDFRKALQLAPKRPEVYREVAGAAERELGYDAARQVLANGLAAAPGAVELYGELRHPRAEGRSRRPGDRHAGPGHKVDARSVRPPRATRADPGRARRRCQERRTPAADHRAGAAGRGPPIHAISKSLFSFQQT